MMTGASAARGGAGDGLRHVYHPLMFDLRGLNMPIVTAVNGAAAGVGMSFAMMGDIVCASRQAYFLAGLCAHRLDSRWRRNIFVTASGGLGSGDGTFAVGRAPAR